MTDMETELAFLRFECGREILDRYTDAELSTIYNGAGPDSWKPIARDILTDLMKLFKPEILLHDVQFDDSEYPLWTWRQLSRRYRIERAYWWGVMQAGNLAVSGGDAFSAWTEAYQRRGRK